MHRGKQSFNQTEKHRTLTLIYKKKYYWRTLVVFVDH